MIDRLHYYDEFIRNKDIVSKLKELNPTPNIYELVLLNYSRYDSIESKLESFKRLSKETWTEGIDDKPANEDETFTAFLNNIVTIYNEGLIVLNNSNDYIYLVTDINDEYAFNRYIPVDHAVRSEHILSTDQSIKTFNNIDDLNSYIYNAIHDIYICTVIAINRKTGDIEFIYKYGLLYSGKVEIYQISRDNWRDRMYEYRIDYPLPYKNGKDTYIYYPFMDKKVYIGKPEAEVDGNGTSYGFIYGFVYGARKRFDSAFTCFPNTNMAVYSCIFQ